MNARSLLFFLVSLLLVLSEVQAASVAGLSGQSATFSASASGTAPFTYQWYKNGAAISGATSSNYTISSLAVADSGNYAVQVSNLAGSALSSQTALAVSDPVIAPSISTQPGSLSVVSGKAASFSVVAAGTAPFTYQWYKNNVLISGATAATYSIATVNTSYAGNYTVKVSNGAGVVTSSAAVLTVLVKPSISTQPLSQTVVLGKSVSFSVAVTGTAPFTYQWYKNSVAISGANSSSYSLASVAAESAGSYTVKVSNSAGSVTSSAATLKVVTAPTITTQPVSVTANKGTSAGFSVVVSGVAPFSFQWYKNGSAISGATQSSYFMTSVDSLNAGTYSVQVSNAGGSVSSSFATLTVVLPPTILGQPLSLTMNAGKPASFSVTASSSVAMTYQWCKNGVAIAGATASTFTLSATTLSDAGSYSVVVSNAAGSVSSSSASLTMNATPTYHRMSVVSVRTVVDMVNTATVLGFVSEGEGTRRFLVRGVGPGLAAYGVSNFLSKPQVEVHSNVDGSTVLLASNHGWSDDAQVAPAIIEAGAFPLADGSNDAAVVVEVSAGSHTVTLTGVSGSIGTALVEIYELP